MSRFRSILLPVDLKMPPDKSGRLLANALTISRWLGANLVATATLDAEEVFRQAGEQRSDLLFIALGYDAEKMEFRPDSWQEALISGTPTPVLITNSMLKFEEEAFSSILVPLSGEKGQIISLSLALDLASELGIPVDILHVTESSEEARGVPSDVGRISDQFHHEYPRILEELIAECSPFAGVRKRKLIRRFWHVCGERDPEILNRIRSGNHKLVVLEWKGILRDGRARTVRSVLADMHSSVLLVKTAAESRMVLRAGRDFRAG